MMYPIKKGSDIKEEPLSDSDDLSAFYLNIPTNPDAAQEEALPPEEYHTTEKKAKTSYIFYTEETPFKCIICHTFFCQKEYLQRHVTGHLANETLWDIIKAATTGEATYRCPLCEKVFTSTTNFKFHLLHHKLECEVCHRIFKQQSAYRAHLNMHTKERSYRCQICKKRACSIAYINHPQHHEEKSFVEFSCAYCLEKFKTNVDLDQHSISHVNEKEFRCKICRQDFLNRYSFEVHQLKHARSKFASSEEKTKENGIKEEEEKPFLCGTCCTKSERRTYFNKHLKKHKSKENEK